MHETALGLNSFLKVIYFVPTSIILAEIIQRYVMIFIIIFIMIDIIRKGDVGRLHLLKEISEYAQINLGIVLVFSHFARPRSYATSRKVGSIKDLYHCIKDEKSVQRKIRQYNET